jgi:hypothetical protein
VDKYAFECEAGTTYLLIGEIETFGARGHIKLALDKENQPDFIDISIEGIDDFEDENVTNLILTPENAIQLSAYIAQALLFWFGDDENG